MNKASYTIIHHISGESDLLMQNIHAFNEICSGAINTADINFVILCDMMQVLDREGLLSPELRYLEEKEMDYPTVYCVSEKDNHRTLSLMKPDNRKKKYYKDDNLADPENLTRILQDIRTNFPAENYAYVYKGHGGAGGGDVEPNRFITGIFTLRDKEVIKTTEHGRDVYAIDIDKLNERIKGDLIPRGWEEKETERTVFVYGEDDAGKPLSVFVIFMKPANADSLSYRDLSEVLVNVFGKKGLAYILLDCCWGMSLENACIFSQNSAYLVASADESPATGIGYQQFGTFISREFDFNQHELAKMLVANYFAVNYKDYYGDDPHFNKMGVSMTCADTTKTGKLLSILSRVIKRLDSGKQYARLVRAAKYCRDYTYSDPWEYKAFNVDLVWLLENLIYNKGGIRVADDAMVMDALEAIKEIKLSLLTGYLGTNYPDVVYGEKALGGRGITFTFPKLLAYYEESIVANEQYEIYAETGWRKLLQHYYQYLDTLPRSVILELEELIRLNNLPLGAGLFSLLDENKINEMENAQAFRQIADKLDHCGLDLSDAIWVLLGDMAAEAGATQLSYQTVFNTPKWTRARLSRGN